MFRKNTLVLIAILALFGFALSALIYPLFGREAMRLGLDLQGGIHMVYQADLSAIESGMEDEAMDGALAVIEKRINILGVNEPVIQKQGTDRILVELPGISETEKAKRLIGQTALLEFRELIVREDGKEEWIPAAALVNGPANGTLNLADDGSFTYTPTTDFVGTDSFTYRANDGGLDSNDATVTITVQDGVPDMVQMRLETTNLDGEPISSIEVGQDFLLRVHVQDVQAFANGVFAAYLDVLYDDTLAVTSGTITYSDDFLNVKSGDLSNAGIVDEVGATASGTIPTGANELLLFSLQFHADTTGQVTFTGDVADVSPKHDTLVFDSDIRVEANQIGFVNTVLEIQAAGAGEGEPAAGGELTLSALFGVLFGSEDFWQGASAAGDVAMPELPGVLEGPVREAMADLLSDRMATGELDSAMIRDIAQAMGGEASGADELLDLVFAHEDFQLARFGMLLS